jgi:hypothetical protein
VVDGDGNSIVSPEEHMKFFTERVVQDQSDEWTVYIKQFYNYLDQDHDGVVTTDEYRLFFEGPPEEVKEDPERVVL